MARPAALNLSDIARLLCSTPRSPGELGAALKASRATLHRKLSELVDEGLAVRCGEGRSSAYRLSSPQETFASERSRHAGKRLVRMSLQAPLAQMVQTALDTATRLGIGQLHQAVEPFRYKSLGAMPKFSHEHLERAEHVAGSLKLALLHFPSNASHGIYSAKVIDDVKAVWAVQRTLRHRLAWERTPAGSMGVDFDDPSHAAVQPELQVTSTRDTDQILWIHVELDAANAPLIAKALRMHARIDVGDFDVIVDLAREGWMRTYEGEIAGESELQQGRFLTQRMREALDFAPDEVADASEHPLTGLANAIDTVSTMTASQVGWPDRGDDHPADAVISAGAADLMPIDLKELPPGWMTRHAGSQYRVVQPVEGDEGFVQISASHSLQTAIQMALNVRNHKPGRQWTLL